MDVKCTRLLKQLKAYIDEVVKDSNDSSHLVELNHSLEDIAATAGGDIASDCYRLSNLLKELETSAKTSKRIREQYQHKNLDNDVVIELHGEVNADTGEEKIIESFLGKLIFLDLPGENKTAESFQETSLHSESSVETDTSIDEDEILKSFEKNRQPFESPVEKPKVRKTFRVLMDVSNFTPKELYVKILGKYLVVHGEHEALFDEHGKVSRKFTRKFEIPEEIDTETFRALFDCYRVLTIEASLKSMNDKDGAFDVPIYEETGRQPISSTFKSLEPEFEELVAPLIEDGKFMRDFARNLAEHRPSDYIPMENII